MQKNAGLQKTLPDFARLIQRLWPYLRGHRTLLILSTLAMIAEILLRVLEPWPLKWVFDYLAGSSKNTPHFLNFRHIDSAVFFILIAIAVVVVTVLRSLADYSNTVGYTLVGNKVLGDLRMDLYKHIQRLSLSFHNKAKAGDLVLRLTADINQLKDIAVSALLPLAVNFLVLFSMIVTMFWLNWKLALVSFSCLPFFWVVTIRVGRKIKEKARRNRKRQGGMAATATESITAIKVVQALSLEDSFNNAFGAENTASLNDDVASGKLSAQLGRTVDLLTAVATALVVWYGAVLVQQKVLTLGGLVLFLSYLKKAYKPIQDQAKYAARLSKAVASGERIIELLGETPEIRDLPDAIRAPKFLGNIRFDHVSFGYEPHSPVLQAVNFHVKAGQRFALIGPSGIGKSTVASLLLRLYDPTEGKILIDGRDLREYTLDSLRGQIGIVLQENILFGATVRDNIAYGARKTSQDEIVAAAQLANAHEFIEAMPLGYNTIVGERGVTLSAGQRQRIGIARAAIRRAPILILDEPTIGLDEENERVVIQALERLSLGGTTLLITHDLMLAARMDIICYLEGGRVLEQGTHVELMQKQGRYATLYRLQMESLDQMGEPDVVSN
jgi:ATP-binding cassette subfamily B protein